MEKISKKYPEFGYTVEYGILSDFSKSKKNIPGKIIEWTVLDDNGEYIMKGVFTAEDFFQSKFTLVPSNVEENVYENLFYLYFENIKLECIALVEEIDYEGEDKII